MRDWNMCEPSRKKLVSYAYTSSESSDESAQNRRLTRAFAACIHKEQMEMKTQINM